MRKWLTAPVTMPRYLWAFSLTVTLGLTGLRLVEHYHNSVYDAQMEECKRVSPEPCQYGTATVRVFLRDGYTEISKVEP
jgi:hypothetical protein